MRKDRDPNLLAVLDNDVQSQIAPSKSRIENALKTKYQNDGFESIVFAEDSEVSWLCRMIHLLHPEVSSMVLAEETEMSLFFCQQVDQVDVNVACQFFWVARSGKFWNFCFSCQITLKRQT